jgi:uncharacterized LabA/DUF88 family protein
MRAAFYIDGFNLYHPINDLNQPHLKWLNLWDLGQLLIPPQSETLVRVVFGTAIVTQDYNKIARHQQYMKALEIVGVVCVKGSKAFEPAKCRNCGSQWKEPKEKETDINLALSLFDDAYQDIFDHAYLLSSDSDQAATARMFKMRFPQKKFTSVSPPTRDPSKAILAHADHKIKLSVEHLERCLFGAAVGLGTPNAVRRPATYAPPAGWVDPRDRF